MNEDPAAVITVTAEERTEVEAVLRRRDLPPRLRERLEMVKAAALGQDVAAIARWSGRTPETVRRWLGAFRGGWDRGAGRRPAPGTTPESRCGVSGRAGTGAWRRRRGRWDCPSMSGPPVASAPISRSRPASASPPAGCGCCCTQQHFACGRPKHTLAHLQDPAEVAACAAALRAAGEKGAGAAGAVRVAL